VKQLITNSELLPREMESLLAAVEDECHANDFGNMAAKLAKGHSDELAGLAAQSSELQHGTEFAQSSSSNKRTGTFGMNWKKGNETLLPHEWRVDDDNEPVPAQECSNFRRKSEA
jgi:hypothetical protein